MAGVVTHVASAHHDGQMNGGWSATLGICSKNACTCNGMYLIEAMPYGHEPARWIWWNCSL